MAGTQITIDLDTARVDTAFRRLVAAGADLTDPMAEIGEILVASTQDRFDEGVSPEGFAWSPLDPEYEAYKREKRPNAEILVFDEFLVAGFVYHADAGGVDIGTNSVYGATHQYGDAGRGIPTRPFLGVSADDEAAILDVLNDYIEEGVENGNRR